MKIREVEDYIERELAPLELSLRARAKGFQSDDEIGSYVDSIAKWE